MNLTDVLNPEHISFTGKKKAFGQRERQNWFQLLTFSLVQPQAADRNTNVFLKAL